MAAFKKKREVICRSHYEITALICFLCQSDWQRDIKGFSINNKNDLMMLKDKLMVLSSPTPFFSILHFSEHAAFLPPHILHFKEGIFWSMLAEPTSLAIILLNFAWRRPGESVTDVYLKEFACWRYLLWIHTARGRQKEGMQDKDIIFSLLQIWLVLYTESVTYSNLLTCTVYHFNPLPPYY